MAKIQRILHKIFGDTGSSDNFAKFGSLVAGSAVKTKDILTIQSLPAWDEGWQSSIYGGNKDLLLQDLNAFSYEHSRQIAYLFQAGIAEWDSTTEYSKGSLVQRTSGSDATGEVYQSLIDANTGNALPVAASNANWLWVNPPQILVGAATTVGTIPKVSNIAPTNGVPGSATITDSAVSEDTSNVILAKPLQFPDATIQTTAAVSGVLTAQIDVTASRAIGTAYRNLGTRPMFVSVSCAMGGINGTALSDASASPGTIVAQFGNPSPGAYDQVFFIVMPGNYYKVTAGVLLTWIEWS